MSRRGPYRTNITRQQPRRDANTTEDRANVAIDDLAEFEQFRADILPKIQAQMKANASTKDILNTAKAVAVGRLAMIAAMEGDSKTALNAIKALLERTDGPVEERKTVTHQLSNMRDEELDALLITAVNETDDE